MGKFKVKSVANIDELSVGDLIEESDLTIQNEKKIIQFEFVEEERNFKKVEIKTGCYNIIKTMAGMDFSPLELSSVELLETVHNTQVILNEADKFFSRLSVYEKYGRDPRRSILMYSPPGAGKTSVLNRICMNYLKNEDVTVIVWDTSSIDSSDVKDLFVQGSTFDPKVKKLILVIEDIEGGSVESSSDYRNAKSALLNLLDGIGRPFQGVPTFIMATTNDPERSVAALIDRPGRFDKVIELQPPTYDDCLNLLKFIMKVEESQELMDVARLAAKEKFSIAHIHEIIVRKDIDDITLMESAKQIAAHRKKVKANFEAVRDAIQL
jgi:SpoVK/Ycf46/Vps4 family AAA+-type ATPase